MNKLLESFIEDATDFANKALESAKLLEKELSNGKVFNLKTAEALGKGQVYLSADTAYQEAQKVIITGAIKAGDEVWMSVKVMDVRGSHFTFVNSRNGFETFPMSKIKAHFPAAKNQKVELMPLPKKLAQKIEDDIYKSIMNDTQMPSDPKYFLKRDFTIAKQVCLEYHKRGVPTDAEYYYCWHKKHGVDNEKAIGVKKVKAGYSPKNIDDLIFLPILPLPVWPKM